MVLPLLDYEYGRLLACRDDIAGAKKEFELVLSGTSSTSLNYLMD